MCVHACIKGLAGYPYDTSLSLGGALMTVFSLCFSVVHKISVIKMNNFFDWDKTCQVSKLSYAVHITPVLFVLLLPKVI